MKSFTEFRVVCKRYALPLRSRFILKGISSLKENINIHTFGTFFSPLNFLLIFIIFLPAPTQNASLLSKLWKQRYGNEYFFPVYDWITLNRLFRLNSLSQTYASFLPYPVLPKGKNNIVVTQSHGINTSANTRPVFQMFHRVQIGGIVEYSF